MNSPVEPNEENVSSKPFDPFDGLWDETVETKQEFLDRSRGTYYALRGGSDPRILFERFLDPECPPLPDIDTNFVNGDKVRAQTMQWLQEKYNPSPSED